VCGFAFFSSIGLSGAALSNSYETNRTGFEKVVDSKVKEASSTIKFWGSKFLPSRQQSDKVPENQQLSAGSFETKVFRVDYKERFESISQKIFSGRMAMVQNMTAAKFTSILTWLLLLILFLSTIDKFIISRWTASMALGAISALSLLVSIRLSEGWDEFFINLRHSYMLLNHGVYSINGKEMVEATVDFIPLLITTIIGSTGIDLIDAFIVSSLVGNVVVIVFSYLIVNRLTKDRTWSLVAGLLIGLYPNVVWVGATGFSAVLFSGWILAASYFLLFTNRRILGLILLSTLTLVRTEGILFAAILMAFTHFFKPLPGAIRTGEWRSKINRVLIDGALVLTPFLLSLVVRKFVFGHAIPNPISFKNTNFDQYYFSTGINSLTQMISNHDLHLLIVITLLLIAANYFSRKERKLDGFPLEIKNLLVLNVVVFVFILPYYIGGGDWFSMRWNRYGMPFNLIISLSFLIFLHGAFFNAFSGWMRTVGLYVFFGALILGYHQIAQFRKDNYIYSTLPDVINPIAERWQRVDNLASLGQFLRDVLPEDAVVSSPEEATIMYFSGREMLGLLGVSNPDMTSMPFQPFSPGDILHRRRGYESIFKKHPDVIALYEPVVIGDFGSNLNLSEKIKSTLQKDMFNSDMVNTAYYRVGSFKSLEKMGYQHVSISYPDRLFSIFISKRIYSDVIKNINAKGFKLYEVDSISYSVSPELSKKYVPGAKEIINSL
jgi:hypothetical protein